MATKDPIPTQSALLNRIRDPADADGWEEFVRIYGGLIRRLALQSRLTEFEADDVVQEVFVAVCRNINDYRYDRSRCSFKHWLSQMVRWRIVDRIRGRLPTLEDGGGVESAEIVKRAEEVGPSTPELEALWEAEWRQSLIGWATEEVRNTVSPKQFQIFYLHALKGHGVNEVAKRLNVSRTQVYLAKLRIGRVYQRLLSTLEQTGPSRSLHSTLNAGPRPCVPPETRGSTSA